jgi:hypothetical protein
VRVTASLEAGVYVRERGGRLYVWFHSIGPRNGWGSLRVATDPPTRDEIRFEGMQTGAFDLFLDEELPRPDERRRWKWRRIESLV